MDTFSSIRFKIKIANRFRKFSIQNARTHTEAMEAMLNFFDWNDISPNDNLGVKTERINKRINAVIAILKNIEKHQTKPTAAMLRTLFEETANIENEENTNDFEKPNLITENEELNYYRKEYFKIKADFNEMKLKSENILKNVKYITGNFGNGYYRLEISKDDFKIFKQQLNDVHYHNSSETRR